MNELVRKFRKEVPKQHKASLDTRVAWLWQQRFGTIQTIWKDSPDPLDQTACTLILQAIMAKDLNSIELLFKRLEGGSQSDDEVLARADSNAAMRL